MVDFQAIQAQLQRFEFEALFRDSLGWDPADGDLPLPPEAIPTGWQLRPLARLGPRLVLTLQARRQSGFSHHPPLVQALHHLAVDPLLIWIDPDRHRSLFQWSEGAEPQSISRYRVVVSSADHRGWAEQLGRLHRDLLWPDQSLSQTWASSAGSPCVDPALHQGLLQSFQTLQAALPSTLQSADRPHYAMVLLSRLIATAALQHLGWLDQQDSWYLVNKFGQSQQRGPDQFFSTVLYPLWHQGFSLPSLERPLPVQTVIGQVPFFPTGPFKWHPLEIRYGALPLPDRVCEPVLTWLADLLMADPKPQVIWGKILPLLLERLVNQRWELPIVTPDPVLEGLSHAPLHQALLERATSLLDHRPATVETLFMSLTPGQARDLAIQLADLSLLDPACGSGRYLLAALTHWSELLTELIAIASLEPNLTLPDWAQLTPAGPNLPLQIQRHLLDHGLYGVDRWPAAVELARLQLFLSLVQQANSPDELITLPDVTLNLAQGDALIGLISVDSERFDQVQVRSRRVIRPAEDSPSQLSPPLQGNLLQPLMAETYRSILTERQVRLEEYRRQTRLLAETSQVPDYVQADFLRDRIESLNQAACHKLDHLLWSESSQQLGIRVRQPGTNGRQQRRLLALADVAAVHPYHWGFHFDRLLQNQGGFDLIISHLPSGPMQPSLEGFIEAHGDVLHRKGINPSTLSHHQSQILTIDPDLNRAWQQYRGQFSFPSQYFRRSGQYPLATAGQGGRLYWSRLFLERVLQLLRPGGHCALLLDGSWAQGHGLSLRQWLLTHNQLTGWLEISNHQQVWGPVKASTSLSLIWLQRGGQTEAYHHGAYNRPTSAITAAELGVVLQRCLDLAE